MDSRSTKVALIHHILGGNLGEDASLAALRENLTRRNPNWEVVCLRIVHNDFPGKLSWPLSHRTLNSGKAALNKKETGRERLKSVLAKQPKALKSLQLIYRLGKQPVLWAQELIFLVKSFRTLYSCDVLIIAAADHFGELTGEHRSFRPLWKYPASIFKWLLLAKLARVRSVLLNIGATAAPGLMQMFIAGALALADSVGFRDQQSRDSCSFKDVERKGFVLSDPAYIRDVVPAAASEPSYGIRRVVGIAPILVNDAQRPADAALLRRMATFVVWLIKNGYFVRFFCININVDSAGLCQIQEILKGHDLDSLALANMDRVHQWSTEELLTNMSSLDYVVTSRIHGVVFAHLLNKPLLAISDHQCVRNLMNNLGLSPYCLSMIDSELPDLQEAFASMVDAEMEIKERLAAQLVPIQKGLRSQLDGLFPSWGSDVAGWALCRTGKIPS